MRISQKSIISIGAVILMGFGTIAYATNLQTISAKLASPLASQMDDVIAGDGVYTCANDTCTASMERQKPMARDCRALARIVGKVTEFKVGNIALDTVGIEKCNAGLK